MRVLAGDIGGTKTVLALVDVGEGQASIVEQERYESAKFPTLDSMISQFVAERQARTERTCLAIAGPVLDNRVETTNLPWCADGAALALAHPSIGPVRLVNDFVAAAYGALMMRAEDLVELNPGARPLAGGTIGVLGAGTGLGEAFLHHVGGKYHVVPSEGGHADFAPRDELQIGLLRWLLARHKRVSYERVVSGLGLRNIYAYLKESGVAAESPAMRDALARGEDLGKLVGTHALAGSDELSCATVDLFVRVYGAEAGNVALRAVATGGVFLAGGIAAKVLPKLTDGVFLSAFRDKGRLSDVVEKIPVRVVTNPNAPVLGAAYAATV